MVHAMRKLSQMTMALVLYTLHTYRLFLPCSIVDMK